MLPILHRGGGLGGDAAAYRARRRGGGLLPKNHPAAARLAARARAGGRGDGRPGRQAVDEAGAVRHAAVGGPAGAARDDAPGRLQVRASITSEWYIISCHSGSPVTCAQTDRWCHQ